MKLINLKPYTVLRASAGNEGEYDDDGKWVGADQSTGQFDITGNLQPVTGKDMELLPEGFKRTDTRKLYTRAELRTLNEDAQTQADLVVLPDGNYQVQIVEPWIGRRLSHFKVILVKEEKK